MQVVPFVLGVAVPASEPAVLVVVGRSGSSALLQSLSTWEVHASGQQPSPLSQTDTGSSWQRALHALAAPVTCATVQALAVLHDACVGQLSGGSQVSSASITPLPQVAEQSESVSGVAPPGQQPSPGTLCVISTGAHRAPQR